MGDVFPWIVNASCRHFYPWHVALDHTLKGHSKRRICGKIDHLNVYWDCKVPRKYENVSGTLDYFKTLYGQILPSNNMHIWKMCARTYRLLSAKRWCVYTQTYTQIRLPCTVLTLCWMLISVKSGSFHLWLTQSPGSHLLRQLRLGFSRSLDEQDGWTYWHMTWVEYDEVIRNK